MDELVKTQLQNNNSNIQNFSTRTRGQSDVTQLTVSSLDESQRNFSNVDLQPEDQDEELEMSLRSHGSSWVELYPSMISRIKRAWDRQHVSTAADSVLRRYRRWRQQSNRSNLNNTFVVPLRHTNSKPKKMTTKAFPEKSSSRPMKEQFTRTRTTPLQTVTCPRDWHEMHQSPDREENLMSRHQHKPVLVMDFSASSVSFKPKEIPLNKTFTVSQLSPRKQTQLEDQASAYSVSPSRPCAKASEERSSLSLLETAGRSILAPEFTAAIQRPDIYGSPVRQEAPSFRDRSPLKARVVTSLGRSPHLFSRSPRGHRRLVRHLSIDSDFMKLYHKFVCQNKSTFFNGPPCRLCARSSEASRGHSSSALAALALSPHRSVLRKRHRDLDWSSHPQSKRFREVYCTYSPGSKRHSRAMLRQGLPLSELDRHTVDRPAERSPEQQGLQTLTRWPTYIDISALIHLRNEVWSGKINIFKNAEGWEVSLRSGHNTQRFDTMSGYLDYLSWQDLSVVPVNQ
uniref:Uncharacterized protein n=1 Tax=Pundamilia nyererei TaxID=303518 RepID=A0A3B4FST1_9CICH